MTSIDLIAAARPNFMKIAPLYHALKSRSWSVPRIVHTGQHYDANMSDSFFRDLRLPAPQVHLGVGSGSHAEQTGRVMMAYEQVCLEKRPDWIVVAGDVNSTLACALVGAKLVIPVAHLEAGLRSGDRSMPEEINRIATDAISDLLWTPSPDADENLLREGVAPEKIERVGNIMLDSFELLAPMIREMRMTDTLGVEKGRYAVITLHRPSNVDSRDQLAAIVRQLGKVSQAIPLVFPLHPRTRQRMETFGLLADLERSPGIRLLDPIGYTEFMSLVLDCRFVLTDSGGVQEETSYLGIPCLTLRENTERPVTVIAGTNKLVNVASLQSEMLRLLEAPRRQKAKIPLWDGETAARVVASLEKRLRRLNGVHESF